MLIRPQFAMIKVEVPEHDLWCHLVVKMKIPICQIVYTFTIEKNHKISRDVFFPHISLVLISAQIL